MPLVSARYQMLLTAKLIKKKTSVVIHCSFVRRVLSRLFRNKLISSILTLICSQNWCKLSHGQQFSFKPRCYHIHVFNFHAFSRFFTLTHETTTTRWIFDNSEVSSTNIWAERQFIETFILVCILRGLLWLLFSLSGNLPVTNDIRALCIIILSRNGPITSSAFSFSMSKESKIWISKINIETKISDNSSLISGWGDFLRTDLWKVLRLLENDNKNTT